MTAKEELMRLRTNDINAVAISEEIQTVKSRLEKCTGVMDDSPHAQGGSSDKFGDLISRKIELEAKLNKSLNDMLDYRSECLLRVERIDNPIYRTILLHRYFHLYSIEKMAVSMNYDFHYVCRLHGKALLEYDRIRKQRWEELKEETKEK